METLDWRVWFSFFISLPQSREKAHQRLEFKPWLGNAFPLFLDQCKISVCDKFEDYLRLSFPRYKEFVEKYVKDNYCS